MILAVQVSSSTEIVLHSEDIRTEKKVYDDALG